MTVDGRAVALTVTEYEILRMLSVDAGRVVTSESLLRRAWGDREPTDTGRVRAFVKQIRAKLGGDAADPRWIFNERGVGYRMPKAGGGARGGDQSRRFKPIEAARLTGTAPAPYGTTPVCRKAHA